MITLIEKPGKGGGSDGRRSRSDLISFGGQNEGFDYDYYEDMIQPEPLDLSTRLDRFLIGRSNSSHFSAKWKADFELRPTWCDADLSLQQIKRGNATGNKIALYGRSFIQNCLYNLGCLIQRHSIAVILAMMVAFAFCCYGLQYVRIETDIVKLWVSEGGRLDEELHYFSKVQAKYGNESWSLEKDKHLIREDNDPLLKQRPEDENANQGFQVIIQTANEPEEKNLLTKDGLTKHVQLLQQLVDLQIERFGTNWTLSDICFKPGGLDINNDSIAYSMKPMLERLIPCIWITPIDCFYDGSKPVGPHPPIDTSPIQTAASLLTDIDIPVQTTWSNVNPEEVIKTISQFFDIGTVKDFFFRTGIGAGYLDRPCIDPLDPTCPKLAPNYFEECPNLNIFAKHLNETGKSLDTVLEKESEEKKADDPLDLLMSLFGGGGGTKNASAKSDRMLEENECKKYRKSFLKWIGKHEQEAVALFGKSNMPRYPDYGKVVKSGCQGFARSVLNWPKDMILGGVREKEDGSIEAEALQSVLLVSSPTDVYRRLRGSEKIMGLTTSNGTNASSEWSPNMADEIIAEWQRQFTQSIYNHELNFIVESDGSRTTKRLVHPLASTSISDMLAEFCDFNYTVILFGYILMLVYAIYSQMHCERFGVLGVNSTAGLAIAGVLCVTFASISGLGLATWFGIEFNAATTQIVPFLTLGVGVDSVFLLLHNYPLVASNPKLSELGLLMKETGMSILMTSLNNIFSFLAGTMLPIPALRAFCLQTTILLTFNLISIMTIYPALIAIDLRRKRANRRDLFCCFTAAAEEENDDESLPKFRPKEPIYGVIMENTPHSYHGLLSTTREEEDFEDEGLVYGRLHSFLRNYYIPFVLHPWAKWLIIGLALCLFGAGIVGLKHSTMGLDLSDVLPDHTAPAAFLKARDKYFSFYPMTIILRGDNLDFAHKQHLVRNLRRDIGESKFIVKLENGEPSERYWLGLFQDWLQGLQQKLNQAQKDGLLADFDSHKNTTNELRIAVSMICSYGETYDCSRLTKGVKLIDESGTINEEGFYNYLYAWHEYESMFYTVSQANFYPKMHKLRQGPKDNRYRHYIPPAPQPVYSQIPFYLTGLKETEGIVEMIKEIRAICDKYTDQGLDNYPSGIAFTFWEQYLDLFSHLVIAISIVTFAVFCVISIILFNPWAGGCITLILVMMTVELAGFLGWCGIKLNPVSAVSLITAVGIGVEFTAHVVFAFLTSLGTRNDRMSSCIDRVFVPVIHGALSTLLGIIMLGFSEFEFVFKYFFVIMFALIVIGLINGLALLPVILSLIGPPCEIVPADGGKKLPVPPPLPKKSSRYTHGFNNRKPR